MRTVADLRGFRREHLFELVRACLRSGAKPDFRVVHFTAMGNHLHLIVEATDKETLARGMQGLSIRLAKAINRHLGRKGKVWNDRYHATVLRTPTQTRNALCYVLQNARRHAAQHGRSLGRGWIDPCSSAVWFTGWKRTPSVRWPAPRGGFPEPRTWLLRVGWTKAGLIDPDEIPGSG